MITKKTKKKTTPVKKNKKLDSDLATTTTDETMQFLDKLTGGRSTLGDTIRTIRQCDEIKQSDFAKKLGVSKSYLSDLENDRKEVSPKKAAEFARILEYPEKLFIALAIEDLLERQGLYYQIHLREAA